MNFYGLKEGDKVVQEITVGGIACEYLREIENVDEKMIYLDGCDGNYTMESNYAYYRSTGQQTTTYHRCSAKLLRKATDEDLECLL